MCHAKTTLYIHDLYIFAPRIRWRCPKWSVFPLKEEAGGENLEGWVGLSRVFSFTVFDWVFLTVFYRLVLAFKFTMNFSNAHMPWVFKGLWSFWVEKKIRGNTVKTVKGVRGLISQCLWGIRTRSCLSEFPPTVFQDLLHYHKSDISRADVSFRHRAYIVITQAAVCGQTREQLCIVWPAKWRQWSHINSILSFSPT